VRIQINSDKNIAVDTRVLQFVRGEVNRILKRFASKLTRVEVHLSDVNSRKFGINDKRCLIEARPARHRPLNATDRAQTVMQAVGGALTKLRSRLETFYGRLETRGEDTVTPKRQRPAIGRRRAPVASDSSGARRATRSRTEAKRPSVAAKSRVFRALA
jgi:ribosome-associated translation inhibitor RaiA